MIYIISTYYHALISCLKQLSAPADADILVTDYIPDSEALAERLRRSGLFRRVITVGAVREYSPKGTVDRVLFLHRKNARLIRSQLPADLTDYKDIVLFHDDTWMAHYLKDCRKPYILCEDALDSFKIISDTNFHYMLPKSALRSRIKRMFRIGYTFFTEDDCVRFVEVNDADGVAPVLAGSDKLKAVPRAPMFDSLTEEDVRLLKEVFLPDIPPIDTADSVLLLTQPLTELGVVSAAQEQPLFYKQALAKHPDIRGQLVIKPHPRDKADYSEMFPQAVILDRNMPSEMLRYAAQGRFRAAAAYLSTALPFINADKYINFYTGGTTK